jgi:hypothetical protein
MIAGLFGFARHGRYRLAVLGRLADQTSIDFVFRVRHLPLIAFTVFCPWSAGAARRTDR